MHRVSLDHLLKFTQVMGSHFARVQLQQPQHTSLLFLSLSVCLYVYLCLCVCVSVCLFTGSLSITFWKTHWLTHYHASDVWLSVCLSVRLSVCLCLTKCIVALTLSVGGWKLYRCVPRMALPIHFSRHFCRRMYHSYCRIYYSIIHAAKNWTAKMSVSGIVMGSMVMWPWPFQTRHFRQFGSVVYHTLYVVRSAFLVSATLLSSTQIYSLSQNGSQKANRDISE